MSIEENTLFIIANYLYWMLHRHVLSYGKQLNKNFLQSEYMVDPKGKLQESKGANIIRKNILLNSESSTGIESKWDRRLPRLFPLFVVFVASVIRVPMVTSSSLSWVLLLILEEELLLTRSCCSDMLSPKEHWGCMGWRCWLQIKKEQVWWCVIWTSTNINNISGR